MSTSEHMINKLERSPEYKPRKMIIYLIQITTLVHLIIASLGIGVILSEIKNPRGDFVFFVVSTIGVILFAIFLIYSYANYYYCIKLEDSYFKIEYKAWCFKRELKIPYSDISQVVFPPNDFLASPYEIRKNMLTIEFKNGKKINVYSMFILRDLNNASISNGIKNRYRKSLMEFPTYKNGREKLPKDNYILSVFALKYELLEKMEKNGIDTKKILT